MKKILTLILTLTLAFGILPSCSNDGDSGSNGGGEGKVVIGASFSQTNVTPFGNYMYQDLVALCEEKGWELISLDAERDATKQTEQVESLILQDIDLLFYWPYDRTAGVVNAKKAKDAGIPVVIVNADIDEDGWEYTDAFVGPDQLSLSGDVGKWVVEQTGGEGKIVVIDGTAGTTQYLLRMEGFEDAIADYPGLEIIAHEYAEGDRTKAIDIMENLLTAYGDEIDVVYCPGADNVAIGAVQVLQEAGRDDIIVCSIDGMAEAFELIRDGKMTMTVLQKPYYMIEKFGEVAERILAGEELDDRFQYNRYTIITQDNADTETPEY